MVMCLYMAHNAVELEMQALVTQARFSSAIPAVIMYTSVWIGELVFLGFFALLAPVRMTLVLSEARMSEADYPMAMAA